MAKDPDRLYVGNKDRELYDRVAEAMGIAERKSQFLLAMATGFHHAVKRAPEQLDSGGFFRLDYLQPEERALLYAVALYDTKTPDVLASLEGVCAIAEAYAHAGIQLLAGDVDAAAIGTYSKHFEEQLLDECTPAPLQEGDVTHTAR